MCVFNSQQHIFLFVISHDSHIKSGRQVTLLTDEKTGTSRYARSQLERSLKPSAPIFHLLTGVATGRQWIFIRYLSVDLKVNLIFILCLSSELTIRISTKLSKPETFSNLSPSYARLCFLLHLSHIPFLFLYQNIYQNIVTMSILSSTVT